MKSGWQAVIQGKQGNLYQIDSENYWLISRLLVPNQTPAMAFGAPPATEQPYRSGDWIGSVQEGGSCNCYVLTLNPHCQGTHTESIGHLTRKRESVFATHVQTRPFLAQLCTIRPILADESQESYTPPPQHNDWVVSHYALSATAFDPDAQGLILRLEPSVPNNNAFFTHEAMHWVVSQGIEHLLVELPSVDRAEDEGLLSNHRIFWNLAPQAQEATTDSRTQCTITELVYVPRELPDGLYGVSIQLPPISGDALPSTVYLYLVQKL